MTASHETPSRRARRYLGRTFPGIQTAAETSRVEPSPIAPPRSGIPILTIVENPQLNIEYQLAKNLKSEGEKIEGRDVYPEERDEILTQVVADNEAAVRRFHEGLDYLRDSGTYFEIDQEFEKFRRTSLSPFEVAVQGAALRQKVSYALQEKGLIAERDRYTSFITQPHSFRPQRDAGYHT